MLSRTAAAALTGLGLTLLLSWLAAFAMNCELLPEVEGGLWRSFAVRSRA